MNIVATKKIAEKVEELKAANSRLALLEKTKKELQNEIKEYMKDADTLLNENGDAIIGTLQWHGGKPKFDAAAFELNHPKLYTQYLVDTDKYQVLRVK